MKQYFFVNRLQKIIITRQNDYKKKSRIVGMDIWYAKTTKGIVIWYKDRLWSGITDIILFIPLRTRWQKLSTQ